jgi:biopolymer transport protein ExbB
MKRSIPIAIPAVLMLFLAAARGRAEASPAPAAKPPAPVAAEPAAPAPAPAPAPDPVAARLEAALAELSDLRKTVADEKLPLAKEVSRREDEHIAARQEYDAVRRRLDNRALDLNNVRQEIRRLEQEQTYLANLFGEYARNFETRLHIAELRNYESALTDAKTAHEKADLSAAQRFARQIALVEAGLRRIEDLNGGVQFEGRAAGEDGLVVPGRFVLIGPVAYFSAAAAPLAGIAEQRLGSLEPAVPAFADPLHAEQVRDLVARGEGAMPLDASLGTARKIEATRETIVEHIRAGGPVMVPIIGLGALVALLAAFKALALALVRLPAPARLATLLDAVRRGDAAAARAAAAALRGPGARMLAAGAKHLGRSKDLIEESMYEQMLETRFRLNRGLPFIAVGAACSPLLGLLGTVTGIITTFKLITVFGSGDVKMLSAGISEALITTEYGLYIAIPALVTHAFLTRRARGLLDRMEQLAVAFMGALAAAPVDAVDGISAESAGDAASGPAGRNGAEPPPPAAREEVMGP